MGAGRDKDRSNAIWLLNVQRGVFGGGVYKREMLPTSVMKSTALRVIHECVQTHLQNCKHITVPFELLKVQIQAQLWWHFILSYFMYFVSLISAIFITSAKRAMFSTSPICWMVILLNSMCCDIYPIAFIPTFCLVVGNYQFLNILLCVLVIMMKKVWWDFSSLVREFLLSNVGLEQSAVNFFPTISVTSWL